jgi:hypothetical protein
MKTILLISLIFCVCNTFCFSQKKQKVEVAFVVTERDLFPEGIAYDNQSGLFYLGSVNKKKIIEIDEKGKARDFISTKEHGIGHVLGLKVQAESRRLWALSYDTTGASQVHIFDLDKRKLVGRINLNVPGETHKLNDLVFVSADESLITDFTAKTIYKVNAKINQLEIFIKDDRFSYANGITISSDSKNAIVSVGGGFLTINVTTKEIGEITSTDFMILGIDGLYTYKNSLIGIQNTTFPASVNQYYVTGNTIDHARILVVDIPELDVPTTGVIVKNWFYFIANTQLGNFENFKVKDASRLKDIYVMKVALD